MTSVAYIVNIHGAHSYWKQGTLGAAARRPGVRRVCAGAGPQCAAYRGWGILWRSPPPTACLEIKTGEFVFASVSAGSNSSNSNGQCESDEMLRDICESATAADVCERTDWDSELSSVITATSRTLANSGVTRILPLMGTAMNTVFIQWQNSACSVEKAC